MIYIVFWPGDGDQPWISSTLSQIHKIGYEFLEIRNGPNLGKIIFRSPPDANLKIQGTSQSIKNEFIEVYSNLNESFGLESRNNVEQINKEIENDMITERCWKDLLNM